MPSKEDYLAQLQANRLALLQTIDDLPEAALRLPSAVGAWSVTEVLAYLTAWDGERLRRAAFAGRESARPPHDVTDQAYWRAWVEGQIKIKQVMAPRGIKVDLAGTWIRLLAALEALEPAEFARWLDLDQPGPAGPEAELAEQLRAWRGRWERSLPWWRRWCPSFPRHHRVI
jgi:hypothetical protein